MGFHHHYVHGPKLIPRLMGSASGATALLGAETDGLSIDFTDASLIVRDTTTTSNAWTAANGDVQTFWRDRSFTSYASPSPKITRDSAGLYTFRPHNLLVMSEKFTSAAWTATSLTVTDNTVANPLDGATTAATLALVDASATHQHAATAIAFVTTHRYTFSVYAKANTHGFLQLALPTGSSTFSANAYANFNLATGATSAGADATATATDVGSGWYRCSITSTATASATTAPLIVLVSAIGAARAETHDPNSTNSVYAYGAMVNAGPTALTYVKTQAHNLCLQSQTLDNAAWTNGGTTDTANAAVAPDGTTTADRVVEDATGASHTIYQNITGQTTQTYSVYLKAAERTFASLRIWSVTGQVVTVTFNLTTGAVTQTTNQGSVYSAVSSGVTSVGNSWHRCWATTTRASGETYYCIDINTTGTPTLDTDGSELYAGNTANGILAWGAQVELASSAGKYVATTAAAVYESRYELPREWDSSGACQGLLVEEARTNLCLYSQEFDNAAWTKAGSASISANATTSPDGTANADTITHGADNGFVSQSITGAISTTYTASVFFKIKTAAAKYARIYIGGGGIGGTDGGAIWDLNLGTLSSLPGTDPSSTSITSAGNGWYRCTVTFATSGADNIFEPLFNFSSSADGDANTGDDGHLWQAQCEAGAFVTSPIYTGSASVTRAADAITMSTKVFPYGATLTLYGQITPSAVAAATRSVNYIDLGASEASRVFVRDDGSGNITFEVKDSGSSTIAAMTKTAFVAQTTGKFAGSVDANDMAFTTNGAAVVADATGTPGGTATTLRLGSDYTNNAAINGYIRQFMYLPRDMSDAELQTVTT
jgi:hypothetical protein